MDGKTKFLVTIVVLAAMFGIGMSYYKYIILKDIDLYYVEEEGDEEAVEEPGELTDEVSEQVEEDTTEIVETNFEIEMSASSSVATTTSIE